MVSRVGGQVTIAMHRCDGGEEMARFTSTEAELLEWIGGRHSSED
jgi:hypothetical protein